MKKIIRITENKLISLIKRTINEVGGYDDFNVMSMHAGTSMGILVSGLNDLTLLLVHTAKMIDKNPDIRVNKISSELNDLVFIIDEIKKDMNIVFSDFTEDNILKKGKKLLKAIDTLQENVRRILMLKTDLFEMGPDFADKFVNYIKKIMPIIQEYGDELVKTDEMFSRRFFKNKK
jgi:hypothetical protein